MTELPPSDELDQRESSVAGTVRGFKIEARLNFSTPKEIAGHLLDNRWREIPFADAPPGLGVPRGPSFSASQLHATGCYSYTAAQALRWWFHAEANRAYDGTCLETRLVQYEIKHETKWKPISRHVEIGGEDRSSLMPDWGKK